MDNTKESHWFGHARYLHDIVIKEMESTSRENLSSMFPKFVIMYEFFRLIRGEAFLEYRGYVDSEEQRVLYEMEDNIRKKLDVLRKSLDSTNPGTAFYIEEMKKQFDI